MRILNYFGRHLSQIYNLQNKGKNNELISLIDEAQARFGADAYMGWAQLMKANANYELQNFSQADKDYELIIGIRDWKGALHAEAWFKRGLCREKSGELEIAHTFYQRTIYCLEDIVTDYGQQKHI